MVVNEMSEKECRELLSRTSIGRLGCSQADQPYVVPIYFAFELDYLLCAFHPRPKNRMDARQSQGLYRD